VTSFSAEIVRRVPVLKMPPELAVPAVRILDGNADADERRGLLEKLNPRIPIRTLLNAYVMPSLNELRLFSGTLRSGKTTRFGKAIATAVAPETHALMAKHLVGLDAEHIGLVNWLADQAGAARGRRTVLKRFAEDRLAPADPSLTAYIDRLGKWAGYLVYFGVIRELSGQRGTTWSVSRRHVAAILSGSEKKVPGDKALAEALLGAYARASQHLGTKLYIPVAILRDELGAELQENGVVLSDTQLNDILRRASALLGDYRVSFSPFSGPSRGGLKLDEMYAGFVSIRQQESGDDRRP
jgi:hypothetical protein